MPHQDLGSYLSPQLDEENVNNGMLAAEEAIARFQQTHSRAMSQPSAASVTVAPQLTNDSISEQSFCEEEEEEEPSYLSFKIAFVEACYELKCAEQRLKSLRNAYLKEKILEWLSNVKGNSEEAYKRFVWYREKNVYPARLHYRDARKAYFQAFIARQIVRLKRFVHEIKKTCERFIIKPIKNRWESFVGKEKESGEEERVRLKQQETFKPLYSPLEKMQNGVEQKKEMKEGEKQVFESAASANGVSYQHR